MTNKYPNLTRSMLDAIAEHMSDELRDELHSARDWRHPGEFLAAYMQRDPGFPIYQLDTGE